MTIEEAFRAGYQKMLAHGIPAKTHDVAVLVAHDVFTRAASGKEDDPRFPVDGPVYAMQLILRAYLVPRKQTTTTPNTDME